MNALDQFNPVVPTSQRAIAEAEFGGAKRVDELLAFASKQPDRVAIQSALSGPQWRSALADVGVRSNRDRLFKKLI